MTMKRCEGLITR